MAGYRIDDKLYIFKGVIIPEITIHSIRNNFYSKVKKAFQADTKEKFIRTFL